MSKTALILFSMIPSIAFAAGPLDYVVKVSSRWRGGDVCYEGSGSLVQYRGKTYVLTSEHVVFHDNTSAVHQFMVQGQSAQPMSYVASDWGLGLALLQTSLPPSATLPDLASLGSKGLPPDQTRVMVAGYPVHSATLVVDPNGSVASTSHSSQVLADIENLLEIQGAQGEFGMSGGPVTDISGSPLGVLSHETPDPATQILYSIPISLAARWARATIDDPASAKPKLARTTEDMVYYDTLAVHSGPSVLVWQPVRAGPGDVPAWQDSGVRIDWDGYVSQFPSNPYVGGLWDVIKTRMSPYLPPDLADEIPLPSVYIQAFRPRDLLLRKNKTLVSGIVHFLRLMRDPSLKPMARFYHQGQYLPDYSDDFVKAVRGIQAEANDCSDPLVNYIQAVLDLTRLGPDPYEDPNGAYPGMPLEALNPDDIEFVLNSPTLAAAWALRAESGAPDPLRDSLTLLEGFLKVFSL